MISASHQKAIDSLVIQDVYLRNTSSIIQDEFDPKYGIEKDSLSIEFKHYVKESMVIELEGDGQLLRVLISVGARWMGNNLEDKDKDESVMAQIEAEYVAEYSMTEMLENDCIDEFSLKNSSYHVWPYWREFLSSQCDRMQLPKVILPTVQFATNHDVCDKTEETELKN